MAGYYGKAHIILDTGMLIISRDKKGEEDIEIKLTPEQAQKISRNWEHETINPETFVWPLYDVNKPCPECDTLLGNIRQKK